MTLIKFADSDGTLLISVLYLTRLRFIARTTLTRSPERTDLRPAEQELPRGLGGRPPQPRRGRGIIEETAENLAEKKKAKPKRPE